jgi:hypothetical protein
MPNYDPLDWYWSADDGRLFGSARRGLVSEPETDQSFTDWLSAGGVPTSWPRDAEGDQTDAALQSVLQPYGLWIDLLAYAADRRWIVETSGTTVAGIPIATDDRSKIMVMGARVAAAASPDWETVWHGADGQTYPLNAAQMTAISDAVEAHVNATFATFASVKADIEDGVITTLAEIDAAFD